MAWATLRKATETDICSLRAAAKRFCDRHALDCEESESPEFVIDCALNPGNCGYVHEDLAKRLKPLWARIVRRILGKGAEGIAYGHVGYHVD